jgi:GntR family transcriptional repressor for pyruvate dehydrogenase complex
MFAAERATAAELRNIKVTIDEMRNHIDNPAGSLEADMRFHIAVAEAAHNTILSNADQLARNLVAQFILMKHRIPGAAARSLRDHEHIYEALVQRDPAAAGKQMRHHVATAGRIVIELVDQV